MADPKPYTFDRVVRILLSAGILAGMIWLAGYLSDVLIPFAVALLMAYLTHPLNAYDDHPIWTSDPKRTIFRDAGKRTLVAGHRGSVGEKAAAAIAEFIVVDMFANAATGQMSSVDSVKDAARKAKRIYR